jgi:hypothetical protein
LHKRLASIGLAVAVLGIIFAILAWKDSHFSTRLAEWTSQKDFIEFCTSQVGIDSDTSYKLLLGI